MDLSKGVVAEEGLGGVEGREAVVKMYFMREE